MNLFDFMDSVETTNTVKKETKIEEVPAVIYQEDSETAFHPDLVNWNDRTFMPGLVLGEVIGIIPKDVLGPTEERKGSMQSPEWQEQQAQWNAYVWAIGGALPGKERFSTNWLKWIELFKEARDTQKPVRLRVDFTNCLNFRNLEVVEYLSVSEGSYS